MEQFLYSLLLIFTLSKSLKAEIQTQNGIVLEPQKGIFFFKKNF